MVRAGSHGLLRKNEKIYNFTKKGELQMEKKFYESPTLEVISFATKENLATGLPGEENEGALSHQTGWPYNLP